MNYKFFDKKNNFAKFSHIKSVLKHGKTFDAPLISITIPTFQRPELLKDAVQSVLNQKKNTNYEIVIVDNDASELYSQQIIDYLNFINDKRIRYYINEQNIGAAGNWNRCIELASGTWMTILCDDDILFENYLFELLNVIQVNPQIDRVCCKYMVFTDIKDLTVPIKLTIKQKLINLLFGMDKHIELNMYLYGCFNSPHANLYKKELAYKLGGFNGQYYPISDYAFYVLYTYNFPKAIQTNQYLCGYRILCNDSLIK